MSAADLSPSVLTAASILGGLAGGFIAVRIADVLPMRIGIAHAVTGRPRAIRNAVVVTALIVVGIHLATLVVSAHDMALGSAVVALTLHLALSTALVASAAIDFEHMVLPNELTLGAAALSLLSSPLRNVGVRGALVGAVIGIALTMIPFFLYKRMRGRSGMGLGDAKLACAAGAWLGVEGAFFVVFAGAVQFAITAGLMRALGATLPVPESVRVEIAELRARAAAGDAEAAALLSDDPMADAVGGADDAPRDSAGDAATPRDAASFGAMRLPMGPFLVLACLEVVLARPYVMRAFDALMRLGT